LLRAFEAEFFFKASVLFLMRITSALCGIFLCCGDFARFLDFENLQAKDDRKV
jgi:hypothetical protein